MSERAHVTVLSELLVAESAWTLEPEPEPEPERDLSLEQEQVSAEGPVQARESARMQQRER
jgi:hypothetical protein